MNRYVVWVPRVYDYETHDEAVPVEWGGDAASLLDAMRAAYDSCPADKRGRRALDGGKFTALPGFPLLVNDVETYRFTQTGQGGVEVFRFVAPRIQTVDEWFEEYRIGR